MSELLVSYVDSMGTDLTPVNAARISFAGKSAEMTPKDEKLINYLAEHQHLSPFEHQTLTVIVECPLYLRSQWHRHRTQAFNEVSRRYTEDNIEFYFPPVDDIRAQSKSNKQGSEGPVDIEVAEEALRIMMVICQRAYDAYERLLDMGIAREQARAVLPQALMTKFYATANLRNWAHFLSLRLDGQAQKEIRDLAEQVANIIKERWPVSYAALMENM